jgi:hypothetical protein
MARDKNKDGYVTSQHLSNILKKGKPRRQHKNKYGRRRAGRKN